MRRPYSTDERKGVVTINRVILSGNLATEPEVRYVGGGQTAMCSFRLAVQRRFSNAQGVREADFLNVVCWKSTAENVARYLHKGSKALVSGSVQERSYEKGSKKLKLRRFSIDF